MLKRVLLPLLFGLTGAAILVSLGIWQMHRLEWKRGILADIEARIAADPAPLPASPDPAHDRYQPVLLTGEMGDKSLHVLVSLKQIGAAYRVISPFTTNDGRRVLVDRGYYPLSRPAPVLRAGAAEVLGNLHWPDDRTSATPENDVAGNIWFARDVAQMASVLKTEPILVVARRMSPADKDVTPFPVDTSGIPNDHLQYAITWFLLAVAWLMMTAGFLWQRRKGKEG